MFTIEQSTFLHALGYAIGHSLWQMSLLWLVYTAIVHVTRWTSSQRYNLAVSVAGSGFAWFITTLIYYFNHIDLADNVQVFSGMADTERNFTTAGKFVFIYYSAMATLRSLAPYFSCAYLVVMLVLSIRLANGFNQVKQLRTQGLSKASVDWRLFVKKHAELLGIKKQVLLHISSVATSPLTIGFWKPVILIPFASVAQLSPQQLEAVLLHELAHIRRHDYLLNILLQLAEITLFFNPFMRLLLKQARLERENCCDDYVLQFQYSAAEYAKALLAIEKHSEESLLALGTNNQDEFQLLNRIRRMVAPERRSFNYRQQLSLLFLITLLGFGFTVIGPKQQSPATPVAVTKKEVRQEETISSETAANTASSLALQAIDLVKQLEYYKEGKDVIDSEEVKATSEKLEADVEKLANQLSMQIQPHLERIEKSAFDIAQVAQQQHGIDNFQIEGNHLEELANIDWSKMVVPPFENNEAVMALISGIADKEGWNAQINEAIAAAKKQQQQMAGEYRAQMKQVEKAQKKIRMVEQEKHMIHTEQMIEDSIRIAFGHPGVVVAPAFEAGMAKAKKAAAIAPFRVNEREKAVKKNEPVRYFRFNYSNNNNPDDDEPDENENENEDDDNMVYREAGRTATRNAKCPNVRRQKGKTVTVFNGKAFSDKVQQEWTEAQQHVNAQWGDNIQLNLEVEKELKELNHVELKARITTRSSDNGKTIVIEVETMP